MGLTDILERNRPTRIGNIAQFPIKSRVGTGLYVGKYRWINNSGVQVFSLATMSSSRFPEQAGLKLPSWIACWITWLMGE